MFSRWFLAQLILSTLKMETICSSETSVVTQRTTRRYIPEDGTLHNHRCENLKSYTLPSICYCLTTRRYNICGVDLLVSGLENRD
jgi:hypothetical protein